MRETEIRNDSRILVRIGLLSIPISFIVINVTSLAFIDPLATVMIEDGVLCNIDLITGVPVVRYLNQMLPVLVLIILLSIYCFPIFKEFWRGRPDRTPEPVIVKRLMHAPTMVALCTAAGWIYSIPIVIIAGLVFHIPMDASFYIQYSSHSFVLFGFDFVISYYVIEALVKTVILPRVLKGNEALNSANSFSLSTPARLMILSVFSFVLPSVILLNAILILNNGGNNPLNRDLIPILTMTFPVLLFLVIMITGLKILSIETPIVRLTAAAEGVEKGDYSHEVTVSSVDRTGMLGAAFNNMISGLAERDKMSRIFGKAVDPRVRDRLMKMDISTKAEITEATVVFFDLAGFTTIAETVPPKRVVQLLNIYFEAVSTSVEQQGGLINKFIGDGVLAVFGVPNSLENHAEHAMLAVEKLERIMKTVNLQLQKRDAPQLHFRAGIHSGKVLSGLIGSKNRKDYTVIGDAVNIASRLEKAGKEYNAPVVLSKTTAGQMIKKRPLRPLGNILLRGRQTPMELFSLNKGVRE